MEVVIFGTLFIVLHLINAVFGSLRFNKDQEVFTTIEILSPVVGLAMSIMFMTSYWTESGVHFAVGYSLLFFAYVISLAFSFIRPLHKEKFKWSKWVIMASSIAGLILTLVYSALIY